MLVCTCECSTQGGQKGGVKAPKAVVPGGWELSSMCWDVNDSPLTELPALLTTEPCERALPVMFLKDSSSTPGCAQGTPKVQGDHRPSWPSAAPAHHTAPWASSCPGSPAQSCCSAPTSSLPSGPAMSEKSVTAFSCYCHSCPPYPSMGQEGHVLSPSWKHEVAFS